MEGGELKVQEIIYGPIAYGGVFKLPFGFAWVDESEGVAVRTKDDKIFAAERMIDVSHAWSIEDPRPPCTVVPEKRLVLTQV